MDEKRHPLDPWAWLTKWAPDWVQGELAQEKSYLEWAGEEIKSLKQQLSEKDKEIEQLRDALTEQLDRRGFAFRGRCDAVPEDIERAFSAMGICTEE